MHEINKNNNNDNNNNTFNNYNNNNEGCLMGQSTSSVKALFKQ